MRPDGALMREIKGAPHCYLAATQPVEPPDHRGKVVYPPPKETPARYVRRSNGSDCGLPDHSADDGPPAKHRQVATPQWWAVQTYIGRCKAEHFARLRAGSTEPLKPIRIALPAPLSLSELLNEGKYEVVDQDAPVAANDNQVQLEWPLRRLLICRKDAHSLQLLHAARFYGCLTRTALNSALSKWNASVRSVSFGRRWMPTASVTDSEDDGIGGWGGLPDILDLPEDARLDAWWELQVLNRKLGRHHSKVLAWAIVDRYTMEHIGEMRKPKVGSKAAQRAGVKAINAALEKLHEILHPEQQKTISKAA